MRDDPALLSVPLLVVHPLYPAAWHPPLPSPDARGAEVSDSVLARASAARLAMRWDDAQRLSAQALAAAQQGGSVDEVRAAAAELAGGALLSGRLDAAESACAEMDRVAGGDAGRLAARVARAVLRGVDGDAEGALALLDDIRAGGSADGPPRVWIDVNRAQALLALGDAAGAEAAALDALRAARRNKDEHLEPVAGLAAALAHLGRGLRNEARARLGASVRAFSRAGDVLRTVQCHHLLGEIAYDGEDPIRAGGHYRDGLALARPAGALDIVDLLTLRFEHR